MQFNKNRNVEKPVENVGSAASASGYRFNANRVKDKMMDEKPEEKASARPLSDNQAVNRCPAKVLPKFINKSAKAPVGTGLEIVTGALDLSKTDSKGYRESFEGKMLLNFWTFDKKTNHQQNLIPAYVDTSEWLNICHMITSGRLFDMTEEARAKQKAGNYRYCGYIYQSNGGSYSQIFRLNGQKFGGDAKHPIATVFKITPANAENHWTFQAEIFEGQTSDTGLIAPISGKQALAKVTVLLSFDDLIRIAKMSEMVIQAHFTKMMMQ